MQVVEPLLAQADPDVLAQEVRKRWKPTELCRLLEHHELDIRHAAVVVLGLVGGAAVLGCLCRCLHDENQELARNAEHSIWSVWFRLGSPAATPPFREGVSLLSEEQFAEAVKHFGAAIEADETFAEAYNQRAIAQYYAGRYGTSLDDCQDALARMPSHFGALSGMGHCYAHLGLYAKAVDSYDRALAINPHMPAIRDMRERLARRCGT